MPPAERKRAQRERDAQAVSEPFGNAENLPLRVLLAVLSRAEESDVARQSAHRAWAEIGRRYDFVTDKTN